MSNHNQSHIHRRTALKRGTTSLAAAMWVTNSANGVLQRSPNNRLSVGVIGLGSRGFNLIDEVLKQPDSEITMICDVDSFHHRDRPWGQGQAYGLEPARDRIARKAASGSRPKTTKDYRDVCTNDAIDVVIVATPDHWHAHCTLAALQNGKDIYCEKPVTHTFAEGQRVYQEASRQQAIFQTGSQQRSDAKFRRAVELVRNGHLGTLSRIEVGLNPGYQKAQNDTAVQQPPDHLDYDFWCGPAPMLPYMRARHHRWWRGHRAYGGGVLMDWIGHHNDIAHWALDVDKSGPSRVEAVNWRFPRTPVYNTPHHYEIRCTYDDGVESSISSRHRQGVTFRGSEGWVYVTRGKLESSDHRWLDTAFDPGPETVYRSDNHMRNFLDCVRSRRSCICPAETGHRSITPGHLGYVSHQLSRPITWDATHELVIGDEEATQLLTDNQYRTGWES